MVSADPLMKHPAFALVAETGFPLSVPGGCDWCDAEQRVRRMRAGTWTVTVMHDEGCPDLARRQRPACNQCSARSVLLEMGGAPALVVRHESTCVAMRGRAAVCAGCSAVTWLTEADGVRYELHRHGKDCQVAEQLRRQVTT